MATIDHLRRAEGTIVCIGLHPGITQSIVDYDHLRGRATPSVAAIVAGGRKQTRFFWGDEEIEIPVVPRIERLSSRHKHDADLVLNVQSARRVLASTAEALEVLPNVIAGTLFAEHVPEAHALELSHLATARDVLLAGPSSVGLLVPGSVKLGAIGGTQPAQLGAAGIVRGGDHAVLSTSGGMINEIIHTVTGSGLGVSFALALGGDRYPATSPAEAFLLAEADTATRRIVYFGELGGTDEHEIAALVGSGRVTKPVVAYVAGTVAELFEEPPQFGHAKAMAAAPDERAEAKKDALRAAGVTTLDTFADLGPTLARSAGVPPDQTPPRSIGTRRRRLIASHISGDVKGDVQLLGQDLLAAVDSHDRAGLVMSLLLGHQVGPGKLVDFSDYVTCMLVDHGPYVSGALNTIVAARAGKDLVSSLAAGLLTIGPRFGGALNAAAGHWLQAVRDGQSPKEFVDSRPPAASVIAGIGHAKYRTDMPDPRVQALCAQFTGNANGDRYLDFALGVEQVTTRKKGNLILNVDGAIAAIMLDLLESELGYEPHQLQELVDIEFFNALFVLSRSVGFASHYLDQRRHDEGLLRLTEEDVAYLV
jgi:ATP citrate (pro-S)-lyase